MIRVHIICEGQTEETFVKELLDPYFTPMQIYVRPALIGKPGHKGGAVNADRIITDCSIRLLEDPTAYCTTFFDFYALPSNFPGREEAATKHSIQDKAGCIQNKLAEGLQARLGTSEPMRRFIPYVQMYEYEGLLFSEPTKFAQGINQLAVAPQFQAIRSAFPTPEDINDSPRTAPSKRVIKLIPDYQKPILGTLAALEIGLETIRQECRLFDDWIKKLEALKPHAN